MMKPSTYTLSLLAIFFFFGQKATAATCSSIASGNWHNPAIWSCGQVPVCGDYINISSGHTVTVNAQVNMDAASGCTLTTFIHIAGNLIFENGNKIRLTCGSGLEVMNGATMQPGSGGGSSNLLEICETIEWKTSDGTVPGYEYFGSPLALASEFKSFTVDKKQDLFSFIWVISASQSVHSYNVYQSKDGINWELILEKESIGDHNEEYVYSGLSKNQDKSLGIQYFKLEEIDENGNKRELGKTSYSQQENEISLYPNPVLGQSTVNVSLVSSNSEEKELKIINSLGQEISSMTISLGKGRNLYTLDVSEFRSGVYFLKFSGEENIHKLIINK